MASNGFVASIARMVKVAFGRRLSTSPTASDPVETLTRLRDRADRQGEGILAYLIDMALTETIEVQKRRGTFGAAYAEAPINSPKREGRYPDRDIDCQQAIEGGLAMIRLNTRAAGWGAEEISEAIDSLTMADRRSRNEAGALDAFLLMQRISQRKKT